METIDKVIEVLKVEMECVKREYCDRHCENCDLLMKTEDVIEAYNNALHYLKLYQEFEALPDYYNLIEHYIMYII